MITLEAAVAELEAMEDPMEVLRKYPNDSKSMTDAICRSCPAAAFFKEKTGISVWVTNEGVRPDIFDTDRIEFSNKLAAVIAELDLERWRVRHGL